MLIEIVDDNGRVIFINTLNMVSLETHERDGKYFLYIITGNCDSYIMLLYNDRVWRDKVYEGLKKHMEYDAENNK